MLKRRISDFSLEKIQKQNKLYARNFFINSVLKISIVIINGLESL